MSMGDQFLATIRQIIENNIDNENFSVTDLAKDIGLSRSALHRNLIKLTGRSPTDLITEIRLAKAKELLENNTATASEIAYKVGFKSPSYFHKVFKKAYQITPGEVRRKGPGTLKHPATKNKSGILGSERKKRSRFYVHLRLVYFIGVIVAALAFISILSTIIRTNRSNELKSPEPTIAVVTFENLSSDSNYDYIGIAFTEEIITELQKIHAFERVLDRTSTMQFDKETQTIAEIAKKLNVNYIVVGSIQRERDDVRIRVRLIRAKDEKIIWSDKYDRKWEDIFSIQDEIAYNVANKLMLVLSPEEKELIDNDPTPSITAYDYYQSGMMLLWEFQMRQDVVALGRAEKLFAEALKHDNNYALAYSGKAWIYFHKNRYDYFSENYLDSTLIIADVALHNDPRLAEAHLIKGICFDEMGLMEKSIESLNKAIRYNSNDWKAYFHKGAIISVYGQGRESIESLHLAAYHNSGPELPGILRRLVYAYCNMGYHEIANEYANKALMLDGDTVMYMFGSCDYPRGNYEKVMEANQYALSIDSSWVERLWGIGVNASMCGKHNVAIVAFMEWLAKKTDINKPWINGMHRIGYTLYQLGRFEEAEFYFNRQLEYGEEQIKLDRRYAKLRAIHYDLAGVYAFRGDKEKAYHYLHKFNERTVFPLWWVNLFKKDPLFDSLRDEPEFQQILRDVEAKYQAEHERVGQWLEEKDILLNLPLH